MNGRYRTLFDFGGKTVIVTGAASGLGREISRALADFGADVVIADKNAPGLRKVAAELEPAAASVLPCPTDVSVPEQVDALVSAALGVSGRIDALIHCAGIGGRSPAVSYPMELWDEVISVNAGGTFLCTQAVGRVMLEQENGGAIVNLSSIGGMVGKPGSVGYQVSKAMEIQIAKSLGVEWGPHGVRVNSIAPGLFMTETIRAETEKEPDVNADFMKMLPRGRAGELHEIVGAALFLASDAGSYVTGAVIPVDGGALAW
ncbi:MAG: SDR family NAD(P)-dependent oxidoreductase [Gammaproteobacteria bacterium]|nr:SDR family NAD(P)-dependent oxidoreductase [Gammaproteobacteria bacterium]